MTALPATPGPAAMPVRGGGAPLPVRSAVLGVGSHAPDGVLTNADMERMVDTSDRWILERTGVHERRRVGEGETSSVLGAIAAQKALDDAGNPPVDAILVATSSPDTLMPSTACLVQRRLGMEGQLAFDLAAACSGFVYGITVGDALIRSGAARTVLVVAAEAITTLVDYTDRTTCVLFGDGAGAVVLGAVDGDGPGIVAARTGADGGLSDLIYYGPGEAEGQEGDALRMAGRGTFRVAVERMSELAVQLCADAGWSLDEVRFVVPHQANLRIVEAIAKRIDLPMERVVYNGDRYGNTSAASIPLALDGAYRSRLLQRGDRLILLAFGSGATWGGVACQWAKEPPR